jgi:hypothetical protein
MASTVLKRTGPTTRRHREERSDDAIQKGARFWIASLRSR